MSSRAPYCIRSLDVHPHAQPGQGQFRLNGGVLCALLACVLTTPAGAAIVPTGDVVPTYNGTDNPWAIVGQLIIADTGTGSLDIDGGSQVSVEGRGIIGNSTGSDGDVTVTGSGSKLDIDNSFYVGGMGNGNLTISDGGTVDSTALGGAGPRWTVIGLFGGAMGTATVTGANSTWTITSILDIGYSRFSSGILNIEDGGEVRVERPGPGPPAALYTGIEGGHGEITVEGTDSRLYVDGVLGIGGDRFPNIFEGDGHLTVSNGGQVYVEDIGVVASGNGPSGPTNSSTTVTGEGSTWESVMGLQVYGTGVFTVEEGATVHSGTHFGLGNWGTVNLSGGDLNAQGTFNNATGTFNFTGGTLKNSDYVGDLTNAGGTFAPGNSTAISTVSGFYTQDAASTLQVELGGLTVGDDFDRLDVYGMVTLAGMLDVELLDGFVPTVGEVFEVLTSATGITGTFDTVDAPGLAVLYGATNIILEARLLGDLNGDGFVGIDDLNIVLTGWNTNAAPGAWNSGDSSGDGFIGIDDLNLVLGNWNAGTPPGNTVPEPAIASLSLIATLPLLTRRKGAYNRHP